MDGKRFTHLELELVHLDSYSFIYVDMRSNY